MARLDDPTGKYLILDLLPEPPALDPGLDKLLLPTRIAVSDGVHEWEATVAALTADEVRILADASMNAATGGEGGILPTDACVIEFGIRPEWLIVTLDEPLIPSEDTGRVAYQVSYQPTPEAYRRFGSALLEELAKHEPPQLPLAE